MRVPKFKTVRGMRDFLPEDAKAMRYVENLARKIAKLYGYKEVITPVVESYELLAAKSGEEIRQRMYAFKDLGGRKVALRPEFTASIARMVATTLRNEPKPLRLFCVGSLYRYDEPQLGRYREFWQSNFELMGSNRPEADAEILTLTNDLMQRIGLKNYWFKIGHMGILRGILSKEGVKEEEQNPIMQKLDKKLWDQALKMLEELKVSEKCLEILKNLIKIKGREIAKTINEIKKNVKDYEEASAAVENLEEILNLTFESGIRFEVSIEPAFARGLEYYTGMIFEVFVPELEIALGGGGRYDKLIELFGGEPSPAVGVAHGIDRITLAMEKQEIKPKLPKEPLIFIIPVGEDLRAKALEIASQLRIKGVDVEVEVMGRSLTRALQDADRRGATHAVIVAPKELKEGKIILRNMQLRTQKSMDIQSLFKEFSESQ
ncbi:ATP phosphoribosyltransferase regulatory subunit [Candidatus Bathyarchaeota archaeon]|nr:MAG: ATP phosphoribosyltransferase regulatory subunit [Candidatus Bathyarchaeota archaeon]